MIKYSDNSIYSLDDLKVGQVIDVLEIQKKEQIIVRTFNSKGDVSSKNIGHFKPVNPRTFRGKITKIEGVKITVKFPDGTETVIEWINFIIWVLPKLQAIFFLVKTLFTKKVK